MTASRTAEAPVETDWWRPDRLNYPLGYPAAVESMTTIAAPLLAGFSIALIGVIAQASDRFRLPGVALLLLTVAVIAFVVCVQSGFWARQYLVRPDEVRGWYELAQLDETRTEQLRRTQAANAAGYLAWTGRVLKAYRLALLALLAGLTVALPPTRGGAGSEQAGWRWLAAVAAAGMFLFELFWIFGIYLGKVPLVRNSKVLLLLTQRWFQPVRPARGRTPKAR